MAKSGRLAALFLATLACGCSTLKTASLRDARLLKQGESEITGELSPTLSIERATWRLASREDATVRAIYDSLRDSIGPGRNGMPVFGFGFAHGLAGGWELSAGLGSGVIPSGAVLAEAGLKKRLYANRYLAFAAFTRVAVGRAGNTLEYHWPDSNSIREERFSLGSKSLEGDAVLLALVRPFRRLSLYYNVGATAGALSYDLEHLADTTDWRAEGYVNLWGTKHHVGLVLEFESLELVVEQGFLFYERGFVPSLGVRFSFKDGFKE
jgi:hypothetical protein